MPPEIVHLLLALGLTACGAVPTVIGLVSLGRALRSPKWPSVEAEVLGSQVRSEGTEYGRLYLPRVRYRYRVQDQIYEGSRVVFGGLLKVPRRADAERVATRYPAGNKVALRYDPANPRVAVLEPGARWHVWLTLGVGGLVTVLGLIQVGLAAAAF